MKRLILLAPLLAAGCKANDVDILVKVGRKAGDKAQASFGLSPDLMAGRVRGPLEGAGLAGRVRVRLLFDRYVGDTAVEIGTPSPGVVRLRAAVPDAAARQRILDLARSTTGVDQVIDEVSVERE